MLIVGDFVLNTDSRKLYDKDKREVSLAPTLYTLLKYFVDHQNQVLSRDSIIANVWKGKIVVEANVNQNIKKLRDVLGDSANDPKYIETVTGEGFRFIANSEEYRAAPAKPSLVNSRSWISFIIFLLIAAGIFIYLVLERPIKEQSFLKELVPLTTLKGLERYPQISPDKQYVLFSHKKSEQSSWDIYSKPLNQESYNIVIGTEDDESFPVISPSGNKLIYHQYGKETCGLYMLDIDENIRKIGEPKLVRECSNRNELLKAEWINDKELFLSIKEDFKYQARIYHFDLESREQTRVSKPENKGFGDYVIKYSKSEDKLAYIRDIGWASSEIWVYDRARLEHRKIKTTSLKLAGLDWDTDGWIYFQSGNKEISRISALGTNEEVFARFSAHIDYPFLIDENTMGVVKGDYIVVDVGEFDLTQNKHNQLISSSFNDFYGFSGINFVGFVSNRYGDLQVWIRDQNGNDVKLTDYSKSYEIKDLSASTNKNLIIFNKSGHINIIDTTGKVYFNSENYTSQAHINPVFDDRNERFLYAVELNDEWQIESRNIYNPADKKFLLKGTSARPCEKDGCYYYFKNNDPYLYKYSTRDNSSTIVAEVGLINSVSEWDMYDDNHIIYAKKDKSQRFIVKLNIFTKEEEVLMKSKSDNFSFDKKANRLYTNIRSQGNTDIMSFNF